jgi:DNA-directed RNA polymerase subunit H (RpoH/RPB5)
VAQKGMGNNPLLLPINKDPEIIRRTVLSNIIAMLKYRGLLDPKKWNDKYIDEFTKHRNDNNMYKINLDTELQKDEDLDTKSIVVKIIGQKLNSISSSPIVNDFLKSYVNNYKIIVFDSISEKAKTAFNEYKNIEVFVESFFMLDLLAIDGSPDYEVLSKEEIVKLKNSYHIDNSSITKMLMTDPAVKYLNLSRGQVVRVIRNSEQTGKSIAYRRVR